MTGAPIWWEAGVSAIASFLLVAAIASFRLWGHVLDTGQEASRMAEYHSRTWQHELIWWLIPVALAVAIAMPPEIQLALFAIFFVVGLVVALSGLPARWSRR